MSKSFYEEPIATFYAFTIFVKIKSYVAIGLDLNGTNTLFFAPPFCVLMEVKSSTEIISLVIVVNGSSNSTLGISSNFST